MNNNINTKQRKTNEYIWWRDSYILSLMVFFVSISFLIFSFMEVPFMTSLHGYTVGLLFGVFSPLFYIYSIFLSAKIMLKGKIPEIKFINITKFRYWFFVFSIMFITFSTGYYQTKLEDKWLTMSDKSFEVFDLWWIGFIKNDNAWFPVDTQGGVITGFFFAVTSAGTTGIGSLVFSVILVIISTSLFFTGGWIALIKKVTKRKNIKKVIKHKKELSKGNVINEDELVIEKSIEKSNEKSSDKSNEKINEEIIPNDDIVKPMESTNVKVNPFDEVVNTGEKKIDEILPDDDEDPFFDPF